MKKSSFVVVGILFVVVLFFFLLMPNSNGFATLKNFDEEVTVYKSSNCGCCGLHASYLRTNGGLKVNTIDKLDTSQIKEQYGVPLELQSCHTTIVGDYFVEGHIPLEAIDELLREQPNIAGIAMPGMPSGSPGMPGKKYGDFIIYAVNHDGMYDEFMRI